MKKSVIYKNIFFYRLAMQVLYSGKYRKRYRPVCSLLLKNNVKSVNELCFGDTIIAEFCRENNIQWTGYDSNADFVARAQKKGFNAIEKDLSQNFSLPPADAVVLCGSLYHFNKNISSFFRDMLSASRLVILSEPVKNITSHRGSLSDFSARMSNAGKGPEDFRFSETILLSLLDEKSKEFNFSYYTTERISKDIVIVIKRNK